MAADDRTAVAEVSAPRLNLQGLTDAAAADALANGNNLNAIRPAAGAGSSGSAAPTAAEIATERERLARILQTLGYLDARVDLVGDELVPVTGSLYRLGMVSIGGMEGARFPELARLQLAQSIDAAMGQVARGDVLDNLQRIAVAKFNESGFPFARVTRTELIKDDWPGFATFEIDVDSGVQAYFGKVSFTGNYRVPAADLARYIPFRDGDLFDPLKVAALKDRLKNTGLFWTVQASYGEEPGPGGRLDLVVKVREKTPSSRVLASTGRTGLAVSLVGLVLLGISQLLAVGDSPPRLRRTLVAVSLAGFVICMVFAVQRILMLLTGSPGG
jgi:hypothetical protein